MKMFFIEWLLEPELELELKKHFFFVFVSVSSIKARLGAAPATQRNVTVNLFFYLPKTSTRLSAGHVYLKFWFGTSFRNNKKQNKMEYARNMTLCTMSPNYVAVRAERAVRIPCILFRADSHVIRWHRAGRHVPCVINLFSARPPHVIYSRYTLYNSYVGTCIDWILGVSSM